MIRSLVAPLALGLGLAFGLLAACSRGPVAEKPDHVVLIVIDTLRADRTTPWGHANDTSPTLARLAREGVRFENAISQCSWTSPSMVSLMTGKYLAGERLTIPADQPTLAESFHKAGYQTAAFICNDILSVKTHFERGFDVFEQLQPYSDDARIVQWLESSKAKRTFTWIHLNEPHDDPTEHGPSYGPPNADAVRFEKAPLELAPEHRAFLQEFAERHQLANSAADVQTIRAERGGYDDDVAFSDRRVANFVAALERAGIYEKTAIVVTADHGEGLWTREACENGRRSTHVAKGLEAPSLLNLLMVTHGTQLNRELVRVPLIVKAPGLEPRVVSSLVENLDVAPTLLELCDLAAPTALHGKSLLKLARDPAADPGRRVFSMTRFASSALDERGYQLIVPTALGECQLGLEPELYDWRADPDERRNLAAEKPAIVAELKHVIEERLALGLAGETVALDDGLQKTLEALGYLGDKGNGIVDEQIDLSTLATATLIADLANEKLPCLARLQAANALAGRTFTDAERSELDRLAKQADAVAVREALTRALGR
jgi:arylsulfatase A-like enzyme